MAKANPHDLTKPLAWSWSRLKMFEDCPLRFHGSAIEKCIPFTPSAATERGNRIHKTAEDYALFIVKNHRTPSDQELPGQFEIESIKPLIYFICTKGISPKVEHEVCLDTQFKSISWWSPEAWIRSKLDIWYTDASGTVATVMDWKTGKNYGFDDQLKLFAALVMFLYPNINVVKCIYIYIDQNEKAEKTFTRDDYQTIWEDFNQRVAEIEVTRKNGDWVAKKSFKCRFCTHPRCDNAGA